MFDETSQNPIEATDDQSPLNMESAGNAPFEHQDFDGQVTASAKPKMSKSTLAMVGVFIAGVSVVGVLSMRGGPDAANANDRATELQVDQFIARTKVDANNPIDQFQDTRKVVDSFYNYASRHQVPVEKLKSNPFVFGQSNQQGQNNISNAEAQRLEKRRIDLQKKADSLKLQSIMMGGRNGTAIIDNNFVTVGQTIEPFTVQEILPRHVKLACEGMSFTLRLSE